MARYLTDVEVDKLNSMVGYLKVRWSDEKEHEDFAEYVTHAKGVVEEMGFTFIKMTQRPFQVLFSSKGQCFTVKVMGRTVGITRNPAEPKGR